MAAFREVLDEDDNAHTFRTPDAVLRSSTLTPPMELTRGDGYRWAALDVTDLDPPTSLPPH